MKSSLIKLLSVATLTLLPTLTIAHDIRIESRSSHHYENDLSALLFTSYESNGADFISSIGLATNLIQNDNLGVQFNTSIATAEVLASDGYLEEYSAWQIGVKAGYFGRVSVFLEAGFDLTEAIFNDVRGDDHSVVYTSDGVTIYEEYDAHPRNDVDIYLGAGAGINLGKLSLEGIVRWRAIDGDYWQADSEIFSGIQVSLNF
ncbi:MAG: hypothetical protein COA86_08485 [Kangiella sp.]|nr:MAG: hypothetical protein COA86_08485 [Kangiella sp.]